MHSFLGRAQPEVSVPFPFNLTNIKTAAETHLTRGNNNLRSGSTTVEPHATQIGWFFDPGVGEGAQERESVSVADPAPPFCCQSTIQKRLFEQLSMM